MPLKRGGNFKEVVYGTDQRVGVGMMTKDRIVHTVWVGLLFCLVSYASVRAAQTPAEADRLVGVWLTESKDQVEIYKEADRYFGKGVVTPENKNRLDDKNPDKKLRSRRLADVLILKGFEYLGKDRWGKGTIYDPNNGKTYRCTITMKSDDKINVRGFVGVSLLGRTEVWPRVTAEK